MWGGVGRGKTWMMDMFYESLPIKRKMRMHFHHFMQRVQRELVALQGQADPLKKLPISFIKKLLSSALMNFLCQMYQMQ